MALKQPVVNPLQRFCTRALLWLRRPFLLHRVRRPVIERLDGASFVLVPEVQNPVVFRSGAFFARMIAGIEPAVEGASALDMGTGSGICGVFAARRGHRVVAIDINPEAVRCARVNVLLNRLEGRVEVRQGDLFSPVQGEQFDLVFFNPPFFRGEPKPDDLFDISWRSINVFERFANGLRAVLKPGGRALVLLSTDGDPQGMLTALRHQGFDIQKLIDRDFGNEIMTIYSARPAQ
ncbi:MAG TPA: methyltransferase [Candidatus Angelobacter sp.]|nr:methyltransferase [Candidatus Angelobacter sp.]